MTYSIARKLGTPYTWSPRALITERSIASSPGGWSHTTPELAASMALDEELRAVKMAGRKTR